MYKHKDLYIIDFSDEIKIELVERYTTLLTEGKLNVRI